MSQNPNDKFILIADYGRSGQGWLSYMLCYILNARYIEPYTFLRGIVFSGNERIVSLTQGNLPGREKTRYSLVIKTHQEPDEYFSLTDKVIVLARDPRDVAVSGQARTLVKQGTGTDVEKGVQKLARFRAKPEHGGASFSIPSPIAVLVSAKDLLVRSKLAYAAVTAMRWKRFYDAWDRISIIHRVTYEELQKDPKAALRAILRYLEVDAPDSLIEEAIELFTFENLTGRKKGSEERDNVAFRKGIVGDHENHFGPLHREVFSRICGETAARWNYRL